MSPKLEFLLLALALALPLRALASPSMVFRRGGVSPDNSCGTTSYGGSSKGYTCPSSLPCCSVYGWCGSTSDYCLTSNGCQSQFGNCTQNGTPPAGGGDGGGGGDGDSGNTQCGPDNGNASCAANECCSAAG